MNQNSCIFCRIIARELPATIVDETEDILVIKDLYPKAPIHYLIIPKKHHADIKELEENEIQLAANILFMAKRLAKTLPGSQAFKLIANNGADAGQHVFHIHVHFLSGKHFDF